MPSIPFRPRKMVYRLDTNTFAVTVNGITHIYFSSATLTVLASCGFSSGNACSAVLSYLGCIHLRRFRSRKCASFIRYTHFPIVFISECRWVSGVLCHYFRMRLRAHRVHLVRSYAFLQCFTAYVVFELLAIFSYPATVGLLFYAK